MTILDFHSPERVNDTANRRNDNENNCKTDYKSTSDAAEEERRGSILQLAQFMTFFYSLYSWDQDDGEGETLSESDAPSEDTEVSDGDGHDDETEHENQQNGGDDDDYGDAANDRDDETEGESDEQDDNDTNDERRCLKGTTIVTPQDIMDSYTYRYLKQSKQKLLDRQCSCHDDELFQKLLFDIEQKLEAFPPRGRKTHQMLERFEVWSTKDLTHALLMPKCDCQSVDQATWFCWSKLLSIPSAAYFSVRWPEPKVAGVIRNESTHKKGNADPKPFLAQEGEGQSHRTDCSIDISKIYHQAYIEPAKHPMCSMILPPNSATWEEYARLTLMVAACLPTEEMRKEAADSPCCGSLKTMQRIRPKNPAFRLPTTSRPSPTSAGKKHNPQAADYKFSGSSLVALWLKAQRSSSALRHLIQLFQVEQTHDKVHPSMFKLAGNHRSTKRRVFDESKLLDGLIEWSTLNHVHYHFHYVQRQLKLRRPNPKKRLNECGRVATVQPSKRIRTEIGEAPIVVCPGKRDELLQASHCHMLRSCFRRNQHIFSDRLQSFAQIESHIRLGKFLYTGDTTSSEGVKDSPFYMAVNELLRACFVGLASSNSATQAVLDDFEDLYLQFRSTYRDAGILVAAQDLVDMGENRRSTCANPLNPWRETENEAATTESLLSALLWPPAPWNKLLKSEHTICVGCERVLSGSRYEFPKVEDAIPKVTSLITIEALALESHFTGVKWAREDLTVVQGNLEKLGLCLRQTELCRQSLKDIASGGLTMDTLFGDKFVDECPLHLEEGMDGCLVLNVSAGGAGCRAGFQANDIIVEINISGEAKTYQLAQLSKEQRVALLKECPQAKKMKEMKIVVMRPDSDVLGESENFVRKNIQVCPTS